MAATRSETSEISNAVQDYAKAIWSIGQRTDAPVSTSAIAERLDVSPASASAMVKRLESLGLVSREPYHGVQLTRAGERVALEVLRHHRLLELYLAEALGMPWDRVHEEAEKLEHAISPELSELIAAKLGNPTHDPHGDPIPTLDGEIDEAPTRALSELAPRGARRVLARVGLEPRDAALPLRARDRPGRRARAGRPRAVRRPAHGPGERARARARRPACARDAGGSRRSNVPAVALADDFQGVIDSLPPDWTHLEMDLRIADEDRYIEAATLLVQINAMPYSEHDWHWRLRSAHTFGHAAAPETVRGTLAPARRRGNRGRAGAARGALRARRGGSDVGPPRVGAPGVQPPPRAVVAQGSRCSAPTCCSARSSRERCERPGMSRWPPPTTPSCSWST